MTQARQEGAGGKHPAKEDLVRFMRAELAPGKAAPIVRHLLAGCARCSAVTRAWSSIDVLNSPAASELTRPARSRKVVPPTAGLSGWWRCRRQ